MSESNWKKLLKSQHADLEKLEAMDADLIDDKIAADIENALRRTKINSSYTNSAGASNRERRAQAHIVESGG